MRKTLLAVVAVVLVVSATALALPGERPWGNHDTRTTPTLSPFPIPGERPELDKGREEPTAVHESEPSKAEPESDHVTVPKKEEPTEEPADITAPELVILHPVNGQVFEKKEVVFEGETERGARVFAGDREADVNDDGGWRIVLFLSPGTNVVKFRAVDKAGNVAEAVVKPVLKQDTTGPDLVILHPVDGQVFEQKEVVFEGRTVRGARVFAGDYEADVNGDGGWRVVLFLSPGTNVVKFRAVDAAGNVSEAVVKPVLKLAEPPKEDHIFTAYQVYGTCSENPPYDVFWGTGRPGAVINVTSEYGRGEVEVNSNGEWELKVFFPESPIGQAFAVKVRTGDDTIAVFEFKHTD